MEFDVDVPFTPEKKHYRYNYNSSARVSNKGPARKHDFSMAEHGASVWYPPSQSQRGVMNSFRNWKKLTGSPLIIISRTVDETDPRGEGFRFWFFDLNIE